jgi:hypothetical protein
MNFSQELDFINVKLSIRSEFMAWLLSDEPSPFISSTQEFKSESFGISILDQFSARQPYLINQTFLEKGKSNVMFIPTIVL